MAGRACAEDPKLLPTKGGSYQTAATRAHTSAPAPSVNFVSPSSAKGKALKRG